MPVSRSLSELHAQKISAIPAGTRPARTMSLSSLSPLCDTRRIPRECGRRPGVRSAPTAMGTSKVQRFGPYVILDRIGDGGMAEIFLAKVQGYSGFEKLIALKKIHPRYSENQTFAQMLIHEAKLAASLQHFNVVQVYDLGEIEGQVFVGMEYVRGRDLAAVLSNTYRRKERLPLNLSLCIATEFMTGLDYAPRMRS